MRYLRGRYFALSPYSYAIGVTAGPAVGGLLLTASPAALWTLALERRPEGVRRTRTA